MNRLIYLKASPVELVISAFAVSCAYFAPIKPILVITAVALFADFISGLWVAYKRGDGWTSRKAWRTVSKILCAYSIIMLCYGYEQAFQIELFSPARTIAGVICAFEMWSILENFAKVTKHPMFLFIKKMMEDRIEKELFVNLDVVNKNGN